MELPVRVIGYVEHKGRRAGYRFDLHSHRRQELMYVDYGKMILTVRDHTEVLSAGDCVLIPAGVKHSVQSNGQSPFSFLNIAFEGSGAPNLTGRTLHLLPEERRLMLDIKQEGEAQELRKDPILLLKLNLLLLEMDRTRSRPTVGVPDQGENRHRYYRDTVTKALEYLEANFSRPFDTGKIAGYAGVSAPHLRRLVRQETGASLSQHLRRIRVESARYLLMWSSDNIDKIAFRVGYATASHFSTVFRQTTGMTPSEYTRSLGMPDHTG